MKERMVGISHPPLTPSYLPPFPLHPSFLFHYTITTTSLAPPVLVLPSSRMHHTFPGLHVCGPQESFRLFLSCLITKQTVRHPSQVRQCRLVLVPNACLKTFCSENHSSGGFWNFSQLVQMPCRLAHTVCFAVLGGKGRTRFNAQASLVPSINIKYAYTLCVLAFFFFFLLQYSISFL